MSVNASSLQKMSTSMGNEQPDARQRCFGLLEPGQSSTKGMLVVQA